VKLPKPLNIVPVKPYVASGKSGITYAGSARREKGKKQE
jgi:hypothetical protein